MSHRTKHFMPVAAVLLVGTLIGHPQAAEGSTWNIGDVFVGISNGNYQVYDNTGIFKETIFNGLGGFTTGCAFNPSLTKLYTTAFSATKVVVFDDLHPHSTIQVIDTNATSPGGHSESIVFDATGNFYVGHPDGNDLIHKYNAAGILITTFIAAVDARGTDWVDLASDQKTLFYTSEGRAIQVFFTDAPTHAAPLQLPNFSVLPGGGSAFALRLLPPGDGSGGLLVADLFEVKRLDGFGAVAQTYDVPGENGWFSLNLDPNGTSFWAGNRTTSNFYRFNIGTGAVEVGPINTGTGSLTLFGICVKGEPTAGICEPVEDPDVRTQGFWKRVCKGPHPSGEHENLPDYVDCVNNTDTFADVDDVDALCDRLDPLPKKDKCEQAEAQFMALLLNICSGRVAVCNCIDDPDFDTVGEAADFIDELLSNPDRTFDDCVLAQAIADDINNGVSLVDCP